MIAERHTLPFLFLFLDGAVGWLQGMELCGSIPELVHTPVCLDCWRRPTSATDEVLAVGDIGGYVSLFNLEQNWSEQKRSENRSVPAGSASYRPMAADCHICAHSFL